MLYFSSMLLTYFIARSLYLLIPFPCFPHPSDPFPRYHQFVLCFYESVSIFCLFVHFLNHLFAKSPNCQFCFLWHKDLKIYTVTLPKEVTSFEVNRQYALPYYCGGVKTVMIRWFHTTEREATFPNLGKLRKGFTKEVLLDLGLRSCITRERKVSREGQQGCGENSKKRGSLSGGIRILYDAMCLRELHYSLF